MLDPSTFRLESFRLQLIPINRTHAASFRAYRNDPKIARYQSWTPTYTEQEIEKFITTLLPVAILTPEKWNQIVWIEKQTGQHIGDLAFCPNAEGNQGELGFTLARSYQHHGYATEALTTFINWLFDEQDFHRIYAITDVDNTASYQLLERLHFRREAHFIDNIFFKGQWGSEYLYALLKKDWHPKSP